VTALVPLAIVAPLLAAAACLLAHRRVAWQRPLSLLGVTVSLASAAALLAGVERGGTVVVTVGGWPAPYGIVLVVDLFSALLLTVSLATVLGVLVFAIGQLGLVVEARFFHPLYCILTAGVTASFVTGDLFNLFVAFEVMLIASYALLALGNPDATRSAMTYVVVSLVSSTLFLTGVAFVYAATGTVNMADLAGKVAALPEGVRTGLALYFLVVFGIKAAIFPLFFWLPDSYPTAPASVTAVFAGLLTKVGVYAIVRTQTIVFGSGANGPDGVLLTLAAATMLVGVLGAVAQDDIKRILSFHIISQIGYMIFGLALYSVAGIAATTLYIVHHIPVKTALFLAGGMVEKVTGSGALSRVGGLARRTPVTAGLFLVPALSLGGIPPFSGFFGKLTLVQAGIAAAQHLVVAVSLVVSLLTLFSMTKIWAGAFWGEPQAPDPHTDTSATVRVPRPMVAGAGGVVAVTLVVALGVSPLWNMAERAAQGLLTRSGYVQAVLGDAGAEVEP